MVTGSLFDFPFRTRLAESLATLARDRIYIGGSSWKYEGWLDQIYTRSNYLSRGRFSKKIFEAECLREYTRTFPTKKAAVAYQSWEQADRSRGVWIDPANGETPFAELAAHWFISRNDG